ncbi:MAG: rhombosortase [Rubrivivax sp.]|nr:rhombosortase [Rubrivivax sp.]
MAGGLRLNEPGAAWAALATLLGLASLLAWWLPAAPLDWQPAHAFDQPWRAWTAAFVHWSPLHLGANLAGVLVVGLLGRVARLPAPLALAWAVAWPLTQFGLLLRPELARFGGLSGVLHAGVAVAALALLAAARGRARAIGAAIAAGLVIKILLEEPWGPALREGGGWDIAVAPLAHATGALAGALCALPALWWARRASESSAASATRQPS